MNRTCLCGCMMLIVAALLSCGCFIQSFHPFYTEDLLVDVPEVVGSWRLVKCGDDDVSETYKHLWSFREREVDTYQKGIMSKLKSRYFKVNDCLFVDLTPAESRPGEPPNEWWMLHTVPVHSVCRVNVAADELRFIPLNGAWLMEKIKNKELNLASLSIDKENDYTILNAQPEELLAFLKKYGKNTNAFPAKITYVFKREGKAESGDSDLQDSE